MRVSRALARVLTPAPAPASPSSERAMARARRAQARLCGRDARAPVSSSVIPAKAGIQMATAKPVTRNQVQTPTSGSHLPSAPPSFPRKRESRGSQPSPPTEIKYKSQPADPFSHQPLRHSRESGNPEGYSQARYPKSSTNPSQRIPSPFSPHPVIPAKAGIQRVATKTVIRNQVQIPASGSLLPLWEKARAC